MRDATGDFGGAGRIELGRGGALPATLAILFGRINQPEWNTAVISKPFLKWGGLFKANSRYESVCVTVGAKNRLGMRINEVFLFWIENGKVHDLDARSIGPLGDTCPPFSPFNELRRR